MMGFAKGSTILRIVVLARSQRVRLRRAHDRFRDEEIRLLFTAARHWIASLRSQ
jgi:hypothetical protein